MFDLQRNKQRDARQSRLTVVSQLIGDKVSLFTGLLRDDNSLSHFLHRTTCVHAHFLDASERFSFSETLSIH
jgi:hypothetical protein